MKNAQWLAPKADRAFFISVSGAFTARLCRQPHGLLTSHWLNAGRAYLTTLSLTVATLPSAFTLRM